MTPDRDVWTGWSMDASEAHRRARQETTSHHAWISVTDSDGDPGEGELSGVPFGVKDNIDVAGMSTTAGSPLFEDEPVLIDAEVVGLLIEAGAVVVGKTNMHELAFGATSDNPTHGPVRNPYDPGRVAGGSSGGSAAAVALGSVPFALGTDTGGSVTVPSAFCGIAGLRPTTGRYPASGLVNLSVSRDTVGLHARTVRGLRLVDRVICRTARVSEIPKVQEVTLGRLVSRFDDAEHEVSRLMDVAMDALRAAGVTVVDVDISDDLAIASGPGLDLVFFEAMRLLPARIALGEDRHPNLDRLIPEVASADVRSLLETMVRSRVPLDAYLRARRSRWELRRRYEQAFAASGADAFIGPTATVLPPPIGDDPLIDVDGELRPTFATIIRNAGPGSVAGVPMLSLPAGRSENGLPVGVCLEGLPFADDRLLAVGQALEDVLPS